MWAEHVETHAEYSKGTRMESSPLGGREEYNTQMNLREISWHVDRTLKRRPSDQLYSWTVLRRTVWHRMKSHERFDTDAQLADGLWPYRQGKRRTLEYHRVQNFPTTDHLRPANILSAYLPSPGLEKRDYGRGDPLRWPRDTLYQLKLALTSPTGCGRSLARYSSLAD
jgi:hypothetical protein